MGNLSISIGGDIVPTKTNTELFEKGDIKTLLGKELFSELNSTDFKIFNLEVPLTDENSPIEKNGPNLLAPTSSIKGIKDINPTLIALANNHILDQGEQGLNSTLSLLQENDIAYVGAGINLEAALKPYILEKNGVKVGIYACTEHEFSIATETSVGANPFDPLESLDHIVNLKKECDYVIVLYHGGKEHYRYPSPYLQKVCRKMAEKGADLVICQHSHCIGCFEEYNGSTIVYGQGNFLFDHSDSEFWQTSLLIKVIIDDNFKVEYIPIVKCNYTVRLADDKQNMGILNDFYLRSKNILELGFIEKEYTKFAESMAHLYIYAFLGESLLFKIINKLCFHKLPKLLLSKKSLIKLLNYIECESHRELMLKGLKSKT